MMTLLVGLEKEMVAAPVDSGSQRTGSLLASAQGDGNAGPKREVRNMSTIAWVSLGLVAGFIASKSISREGEGILPYLVLGVLGAAIGGYVFDRIGAGRTSSSIDIWSMLTSLAGAVVLLVAHHAIRTHRSRSD